MGSAERPDERDAAALVGELLAARLDFVGDEQGMYDYQIHFDDGRAGCLEVTSCTNPERRQLTAEIGKATNWEPVPSSLLRYRWDVWLDSPTSSPKPVLEDGPTVLAALEAGGVVHLSAGQILVDAAMEQTRRACGMNSAIALTDQPGGILILPPGGGTGDSKLGVNAAVERAASLDDNIRKLSDEDLVERHLFVWFDMSEFDPWYAIDKRSLPSSGPEMPDAITHVWAAGIPFGGDDAAVWLWERSAGWRIARDDRAGD